MNQTIPPGARVRQLHERQRSPMPGNLLEKAARCDDLSAAKAVIAAALGISATSPTSVASLTWPERWAKISRESRLEQIGNWIRAECFDMMDLVEAPAISTKGD